jgi:hypothetical protein
VAAGFIAVLLVVSQVAKNCLPRYGALMGGVAGGCPSPLPPGLEEEALPPRADS